MRARAPTAPSPSRAPPRRRRRWAARARAASAWTARSSSAGAWGFDQGLGLWALGGAGARSERLDGKEFFR